MSCNLIIDIVCSICKGGEILTDKLFSISEIANFLGVSRGTVYNYIEKGMPYMDFGSRKLFDPEKVKEWGEKQAAIKKESSGDE